MNAITRDDVKNAVFQCINELLPGRHLDENLSLFRDLDLDYSDVDETMFEVETRYDVVMECDFMSEWTDVVTGLDDSDVTVGLLIDVIFNVIQSEGI